MIIGDRRPTDSVRDLVRLIEALSRRCLVVREGCDNRVEVLDKERRERKIGEE